MHGEFVLVPVQRLGVYIYCVLLKFIQQIIRSVGSTDINNRSSRSHAVFQVCLALNTLLLFLCMFTKIVFWHHKLLIDSFEFAVVTKSQVGPYAVH